MNTKWFLPIALLVFGCSGSDSNNGTNGSSTAPPMKSIHFGGGTHMCSLGEDKNMWCWGVNSHGELGNGSKADTTRPTKVAGISNVAEVVIAGNSSCAILEDRSLWCWGRNSAGQLGVGDESVYTSPQLVKGPAGVKSLKLTAIIGCLIDTNEDLWCSSENLDGVESSTYKKIEGLSQIADVAIGFKHVCALGTSGGVWCWGLNRVGQLGNGNEEDLTTPTKVEGVEDATAIYAQNDATIIQRTNGEIWLWGTRAIPEEGDTKELDTTVPQPRPSAKGFQLATLDQFTFGHSCIMDANNEVWCWGTNTFGQLGSGDNEDVSTPSKVVDLGPVSALTVGRSHACVIDTAKQVWCWGANGAGALGIGEGENQTRPQKVALENVASIQAGDHETCAVTEDGAVWCWGDLRVGRINPMGGIYFTPQKQ